jgi:hypothetical protein
VAGLFPFSRLENLILSQAKAAAWIAARVAEDTMRELRRHGEWRELDDVLDGGQP